MDQYYRSGLPCFIPMSMMDETGKPLPDEKIQLSVNDKDVASLTTDSAGKAQYWLDTTGYHDPNINITITYRNNDHCYYLEYSNALYPTAQYRFQRFFAPTGSFVEIQREGKELSCGKNHTVKVRYLLCEECVRKNGKQSFYVQCLSRLNFIHHQKIVVDVSEAYSGSFTFDIPVTTEYFQNADIIVTSIVRNNVIAHSINVNTEKCFKNEVSMSFSAEVVEPGSEVEVLVTAAPLSFCGLRAYDRSLSSFQSYESLGPDTIFYNLYFLRQHGYNVDGIDFNEPAPPCQDPNKQIFCKDGYYVQVSPRTDGDSSQYFRALGVMVYTTKPLLKPVVCGTPEIQTFRPLFSEVVADSMAAKASPSPSGNAAPGTKETIRTNMAEEFGFSIIQTDSTGHASETVQVPDSITGWIGNALCVSKHEGFGKTNYTANITTFLMFFVDMTVPLSICREEVLVVPTAVSNYNKDHYVTVKVTMQSSDDYEITPVQGAEEERCIPPGEKAFFYFRVSGKTLGSTNLTCTAETTSIGKSCNGPSDPSVPQRKDTVVKKINVEADGVLYEDTKNFFICVNNSSETRHFTLSLPENVVQDSAKTSFGALGDFLRISYNNIDNLLLLPLSCCEHTVFCLLPLVHLMDYCRFTGQLTDDMEKESITKMNLGIQRLWNCWGFTGAYGTFYSTSSSGNSWVTVTVYSALNELSEYVQIDESIQDQTLVWFSTIQDQQTGCFNPQGYSLSLKARTNPRYALTALANIAFHMQNRPLEVSMREKSMACVEEAHRNGNLDVYLKAMLLHSYTLSKQWGPWGPLYEDIMKQAVREGGTIYWVYKDKWEAAFGPGGPRSRNSAEVEMASRVLFCAMSHPNSSEYLTDGSQIALGIVEVFNSRGGAVSSPDTSMALQALSLYGMRTFVKDSNHQVKLLSDGEVIGIIGLTPENRFLQQQIQLPQSTGNYDLAVTGTGCMLAQVTTKCNIKVPKDNSAFSLTASTSSQSCKFGAAKSFTLNISASFIGEPNSCNMPVLEILCITGYSEDRMKLYELIRAGTIGRTERMGNRLYLYFDGVRMAPQITSTPVRTASDRTQKAAPEKHQNFHRIRVTASCWKSF
uniref:Alpha-2-macroglobulin-like protein 1 n=1 Tax=Leptobrachium leishanense TaxID=445787 RepID=A0A8C5QUT5_9ANUR